MKKGITPIIAIIILLLITISLAAAAWTFLTGYFTTLTGGTVEVVTQTCLATGAPMFVVRNIGPNAILTSDIVIIDKSNGDVITPAGGGWYDVQGSGVITSIPGDGGTGKATLAPGDCGIGERCSFSIITSGRESPVSVRC